MGFFGAQQLAKARGGANSDELYHRLQCKACPLNCADAQTPHMEPSGSSKPTIYIFGEMPGEEDDYDGQPFVGRSGRYLRNQIPKEWKKSIRYNNVIRTHPGDRQPERIEIECCRPFNAADIEKAKPRAIFGFGNIPLNWFTKQNGIIKWRGRRLPVKIGEHTTWLYPFLHPADVLKTERRDGTSKEKFTFEHDLKRAFAEIEDLPDPHIHTAEEASEGITNVDWRQPGAVDTIVAFLKKASRAKVSGLDYETSHLRPYRPEAKILTIAVSLLNETLSFPLDHPEAKWSKSQRTRIVEAFLDYLKAPVRKVAFNEAFEMEWTAVIFGRKLIRAARWDDPMAQAAVLDERIGGKPDVEKVSKDTSCLGLGFITLNRFGLNIKSLSNVNTKNMLGEKLADILPYNGIDAKYCLLLYFVQKKLLKQQNLLAVYNMRLRRIPTVVLTQIKGIPLDFGAADKLDKKLRKMVRKAEAELAADKHVEAYRKRYRQDFNPGSDAHCVKMLRDVLGSKAGVSEKKGYQVTKAVLQKVAEPVAQAILDWRAPNKLLSTYIWPEGHRFVYPDGHLHPVLNTLLTSTGRLSSEDPNEQNFPKRSDIGKEIRKQIKAPPGHIIFSVDYAQIEARCIAMASRDPVYVKMLWEGYDVHLDWAQRIAKRYPRVLDKYPDGIKGLRQAVKGGWVFALFFGAQQSTAEKQVGVPEGTLTREYNEFWRIFEGVLKWQRRLKKFYEEHGYVESLTGTRRRAPISPNQLINAPVQALMVDIVMDGMNSLSELDDWHLQPIMQVHDDLTMILPLDRFDHYSHLMLDTLLTKKYDFLNVPLVVEAAVGENLYEMEDAGVFSSENWKS